jgi:hypothetical protein
MLSSYSRKSDPDQHGELNLPRVDREQGSEIAHLIPHAGPDDALVVPAAKPPLLSARNSALIGIILLLLSIGFGMWSWTRLNDLQKTRRSEALLHALVLDSLEQTKFNLENSLGQLESDFADLSMGRDSLAQELTTATNIIAEKEQAIQEIKLQQVREEKSLRAQIQRLQTIKDRYETIIAVLRQKNADLTVENARLKGATDSLTLQVSDLGRQLEAQIRQKLSAQYKATSFRVEMTRRNDKLTVLARRTRELNVSFDLRNVPPTYQGNQQLYLVITDDQGRPIASKNPVQAAIAGEDGAVPIIAQATQLQNIGGNQHIALSYKLEDRLSAGTYLVSVYSDQGLLGVASFRLR